MRVRERSEVGGRERGVAGRGVENSAIGGGQIDARGMSTRCRCTECRRRFNASPAAEKKQRVCSRKCRASRRRKLARKRRREDIDNARAEERERKRQLRGDRATGSTDGKCPEPGSAGNSLKIQVQIRQILDGPFRVSRARLDEELRTIERKIGSLVHQAVANSGR